VPSLCDTPGAEAGCDTSTVGRLTQLFQAVGPFAPIIVFLLAAAESAAFVGVVVPGELAVVLGGVAAGTGGVSLWVMIPAAVVGAILGDSIGYRLGGRMGPALLTRPRLARVSARLDAAGTMLASRGWWALVVARFVAVLRAVVPFAAGLGRMPYRRFLLGNAVGGILWGTSFTLVGYIAGANYPRVERWIRTGGLAVVALAAAVGGIVWITRWVGRHRLRVATWLTAFAERRPLRYLVHGIRRADRPALTLSVAAGAIVAGLWIFGGLVQDVVGSEEFFFFDLASMNYLDANQVAVMVAAARVINAVTASPWPLLLAGVLAIVLLMRGRGRIAAGLVASVGGQWVLVEITAALVGRIPPGVEPLAPRLDYGFPSEPVALIAAVAVFGAWPWNRPGWRATVTRYGAAAIAFTLAGAARVQLLVDYPSDVIAAAMVAAAWTLLVCLAFDSRSSAVPAPSPPDAP
jgi:membrane protein DedA with SNARE-associated domain/membrane-associated phospholipid phosphatase